MAALSVTPNLALAFPLGAAVGAASVAFVTSATALVQAKADPAVRGRVLAMQAMVFLGTTPIGGPLLGVVCEAFGPRAALGIGAAACLAASAWGSVAVRRTTHRAPAPAAA